MNRIDSNSEFNFEVNTIRAQNGSILNDNYYYGGGVYLQKENNDPDWIINEFALNDGTALYIEDNQILLDIWKIKTPFVIYKKKYSNILYLIKNNDTLQFRIYNYEKN